MWIQLVICLMVTNCAFGLQLFRGKNILNVKASERINISLSQDSVEEAEMLKKWKTFMSKHEKNYEPLQMLHRQKIFFKHLKKIKKHNGDKSNTYKIGVNQFSDLKHSEFRRIHLGTHHPDDDDDHDPKKTSFFEKSADKESVFVRNIDWRSKGAVTPPKNQGQCGSCWAFGTTGATEGAQHRAGRPLTSLSEQTLVDCAGSFGNNGCNGGWPPNAMKFIKKHGIPTEKANKYKGRADVCKNFKPHSKLVSIKQFRVGAFEKEIQVQPISVAVCASTWGSYRSGIFKCKRKGRINHAVLLVGSTKTYWIIKNSWGMWGERGYMKLSKKPSERCSLNYGSYGTIAKAAPTPVRPISPTPKPKPKPKSRCGKFKDVQHVCSSNSNSCNMLVNSQFKKYGGTCDGYCGYYKSKCIAAHNDDCNTCTGRRSKKRCNQRHYNDLICRCSISKAKPAKPPTRKRGPVSPTRKRGPVSPTRKSGPVSPTPKSTKKTYDCILKVEQSFALTSSNLLKSIKGIRAPTDCGFKCYLAARCTGWILDNTGLCKLSHQQGIIIWHYKKDSIGGTRCSAFSS